jgi:hypothetical protein
LNKSIFVALNELCLGWNNIFNICYSFSLYGLTLISIVGWNENPKNYFIRYYYCYRTAFFKKQTAERTDETFRFPICHQFIPISDLDIMFLLFLLHLSYLAHVTSK